MFNYLAGLMTGCLIGVSGTFLILLLSGILPEKSYTTKRITFRGFSSAMSAIVALAFLSYLLHMDKAASMLLLLLSVLAIAKMAGLVTSLAASAVAAVAFSILFLPPIGSLNIVQPGDRLLLALFLLGAMIESRLIVKNKKIIEQRS